MPLPGQTILFFPFTLLLCYCPYQVINSVIITVTSISFLLAPCQVINSTGLQYTLPVFVKGPPGDSFGTNYSLSPGCTPGLCYNSSDGMAFWGFLIAVIDLKWLSTLRYVPPPTPPPPTHTCTTHGTPPVGLPVGCDFGGTWDSFLLPSGTMPSPVWHCYCCCCRCCMAMTQSMWHPPL